jgi:hypothetical protein
MSWLNPLSWCNPAYEDDDEKSYNDGAAWAETVVETGNEVVQSQVVRMAEDLNTSNIYEFYDGFADVYNTQPNIEPERGLLSRLGSWFSW